MANTQQQKQRGGELVVNPEKLDLFKGWMTYNRKRIEVVVPRGVDPKRIFTMALSELYREPTLLDADPRSFVLSVIQCAKMGLEIGPHLGHAYLLPFTKGGTGKGGATIIQPVPGYRGIIKCLVRGQQVVDVDGVVVYENDKFAAHQGTDRRVEHEPLFGGDRGEIRGAYAVFWMRDGRPKFELMDMGQLQEIRDFSPGSKRSDSPWNRWTVQMYRKCPIRRGANQLVLDTIAGAAMLLQAGAESNEAKTDDVAEMLEVEVDEPSKQRPKPRVVDTMATRETDDIADAVRARREQAEADARAEAHAEEGPEGEGDGEDDGGQPPEPPEQGPPSTVEAFLAVIEAITDKTDIMAFMRDHDDALAQLKKAGGLSADDLRGIYDALGEKEQALK